MSILLGEEGFRKALCKCCLTPVRYCPGRDCPVKDCMIIHEARNYRYPISEAAAIHAVQYLEELCPNVSHKSIHFECKRVNCPDCMANIKKELGI